MLLHGRRSEKSTQVFGFLFAPSPPDPPSGLFLFLSCSSSREKPGPLGTAGVGKVRGLGSMLESGPERPKPHSGKKLEGEGRRASDTKRLGKADMGVSMLFELLFPLPGLPLLLP